MLNTVKLLNGSQKNLLSILQIKILLKRRNNKTKKERDLTLIPLVEDDRGSEK